jgi:DNA-binding Xre family transcriptional regulator
MNVDEKYVGSSFDDFLLEEGVYSEVCKTATKRVLAWQIDQLMAEQGMSKRAMAEQMQTSRTSLRRLLDPSNGSVTLQTMEKAAKILGKTIKIELVDDQNLCSACG